MALTAGAACVTAEDGSDEFEYVLRNSSVEFEYGVPRAPSRRAKGNEYALVGTIQYWGNQAGAPWNRVGQEGVK